MKKEVSKDYIKYMNNDGQCDKAHAELIISKEKQLVIYQTLYYENNQVRQLIKCTKQNCNDCSIINPNEALDSYYNDNGLCISHTKIRLNELREGEYNK